MELKPEQAKAINHDGGNLLVSASAGSGKTFTMIRRLIRLITEGKARVNEILAVTFTEKAAAEMKEKLRRAMIKEISVNPALKDQFADIYTADICTLHSFCGRLLRTYFYEAGLSADFDVADNSRAEEIKRRAVDELFEELYSAGDERLNMLVKRHANARRDGKTKSAVLGLYEFSQSEADPSSVLGKSLYACSKEGFDYFYGEYIKLLEVRRGKAADECKRLYMRASDCGLEKYKDYLSKLHRGEPCRMPSLRLTDEVQTELRDEIKKLKTEYAEIDEAVFAIGDRGEAERRQLSCREHTEALIYVTEAFAARYAAEKRDANAVDFNDLEHFTLKLLENDAVAREVRAKYKYVFTDEYQDTNGVQESILNIISDNNLFAVGDLKQSIYGFRGCNPSIFKSREAELSGRGEVVYLNSNFRSADVVIDGVNEIFDCAMTEDFSDVDYKNTSRLVRGGLFPEGSGRFAVKILETEKKKRETETPRIYDLTEEISSADDGITIGDFIAELVEREIGEDYFDPDTGVARKIKYGDIAVLTRSRTDYAEGILKSFIKRGIPVAMESKSSITEYAEIKTLIDVLSLIDNFKQDIPLASAMKSLWTFTDEELAEIRVFSNDNSEKGKRAAFYDAYSYYLGNGTGALKEKVAAFDGYMQNIRLIADEAGAADILARILRERALDVKFSASSSGKQKMKRVRRFIAEASGAKKLSVREFLDKIEVLGDDFTLAETGGDDTVKIITVHSSKGLEYPVVILAGIERDFNFRDAQADILTDKDYGFAVKYYDDKNKTYGETVCRLYLKERIKKEARKEELRLFYVALTRAKYSLILAGVNVNPKFNISGAACYADFLPPSVSAEYCGDDFVTAPEKKAARKIVIGDPDPHVKAAAERNFNFTYPFAEETVTPLKTSVTESLKADADENVFVLPEIREENFIDTSAEKGTAMHRFLEVCDMNASNAQAEAERLLKSEIINASEFSLLSMPVLQKLFDSGIFRSLEGYKLYREQRFLSPCPAKIALGNGVDGEIVLQGIIDLLAVKDGAAVIYDYKFSHKNAEALKRTYAKQLALYKYAAERSLGVKVTGAYIISLAAAEVVKIDF